MCGIVGIIGKSNAEQILLSGLAKLEYRGYDSAGIFVADGTSDHLLKSSGRIKNLEKKVTPEVTGTIGIGHTRWATHGEPSEENAHPHTSASGRFVLVHNGVIENFEELKQQYLLDHHFDGTTDTEIAAHLIEVFVDKSNDVLIGFKEALKAIKGSYAFAMIDRRNPEQIYVAKNKSPLLLGVGDGFNVIASDALAVIDQTKHFVEINDGEVVTVTPTSFKIETLAGETVVRESFEAKIDASDIEKGTYPYYMLKEIDEQPAVMRRISQHYLGKNSDGLEADLLAKLLESDRIYIVACGTSYHAGLASKEALEKLTNLPVEAHLASEFGYHMPILSQKPFFIFLSQSGETADSRQVLVQISQLGHPTLTVTNVAGSTLSREADFTMLLHAGPEIAVASTKAYTAQIAVLTILAKIVGENKGIEAARNFDIAHELSLVATVMESIILEKDKLKKLASTYFDNQKDAFFIGRGADYFVSMEAALKLKEISYIHAEGFAAGELKHGTIALIEKNTPVIGLISDPVAGTHTRGNIKEVESRGAHTLTISTESLSKEDDSFVIGDVHSLLTPLVMVIPTQLLAYYATLARGLDVDKPRNLAKSVTVE